MTIPIYAIERIFFGPEYTERSLLIAFFDKNLARHHLKRWRGTNSNPSVEYGMVEIDLYVGEEIPEEDL